MRQDDPVIHPKAEERAKSRLLNNVGGLIGIAMCIGAFVSGLTTHNHYVQIAAFVGVMFASERITWKEVGSIVPWKSKSE